MWKLSHPKREQLLFTSSRPPENPIQTVEAQEEIVRNHQIAESGRGFDGG